MSMLLNPFSICRLEDFRGEPWVAAYCQLVGGVAIKVSLVIALYLAFQATEKFKCRFVPLGHSVERFLVVPLKDSDLFRRSIPLKHSVLQRAMEHFSMQGGAWAEMMTANHMR